MRERRYKKEWPYLIFVIASAIIVSFSCKSFALLNQVPGPDSSVFQYVANEIIEGKMPYLDTFDHKGPLLYVINVIGLLISKSYGLWLIEALTIVATLIICYYIARLCANPISSVVASVVCALCLYIYLEAGNLVEEYAMPFIAYALFIYLIYFKFNKISRWHIFVCGCCFGAVLMLRPNMIAVWIVGCVAVVVNCIMKKKLKDLPNFICMFVIGSAIVIVPFLIWLGINGALKAFWNVYIVFNMSYKESEGSLLNFFNVIKCFLVNFWCLLALFSICLSIIKKHSINNFMLLGMYIFSFILLGISGRTYYHYVMPLVPILAYPIAYMIIYISDFAGKNKRIIEFVISVIFIIGVVPASFDGMVGSIEDAFFVSDGWEEKYPDIKATVSEIQKHSNRDDKITVYGNHDVYYLLSERKSASEYSYQQPIATVDKKIERRYFKEIQENLPRIIVWDNYFSAKNVKKDPMYKFIKKNNYVQSKNVGKIFYHE